MEGYKYIGIVIPKLALTQNHLRELDETDSTLDLMNENLERITLECVYLKSSQMQLVTPNGSGKSPILWHC